MDLKEFVKKQNEPLDEARLEGLIRAFEDQTMRKKSWPWLQHIDSQRVRAIINRGHIHLSMPFGENVPWWSGIVLDEKDKQHNIQITYNRKDFNNPEGGYCWDCQGYCEAAVAAILIHMAQRGPLPPLPKKDKESKLTHCPICGGSL